MHSKSEFRRYLVRLIGMVALSFAIVILAALAIVRYQPRSTYDYYQTLAEANFDQAGRKADILFVGDSALLFGVKPRIVSKILGMPARSIPLFGSAGTAAYELLIDHYLAHNQRPKVMVFYVSPGAPVESSQHSFEKTWTLMKYGTPRQMIKAEFTPYDIVFTAVHIVKNAKMPLIPERMRALSSALEATDGYAPIGGPALGQCTLDSKSNLEGYTGNKFDNEPWDIFADMRKKYRAQRIIVVTYISPVPECDRSYSFFKEKYALYGFAMNTLERRTNTDFVDYIHFTDPGAERNSLNVAKALRIKLRLPPA